jgi:hypothetical protein
LYPSKLNWNVGLYEGCDVAAGEGCGAELGEKGVDGLSLLEIVVVITLLVVPSVVTTSGFAS